MDIGGISALEVITDKLAGCENCLSILFKCKGCRMKNVGNEPLMQSRCLRVSEWPSESFCLVLRKTSRSI